LPMMIEVGCAISSSEVDQPWCVTVPMGSLQRVWRAAA
jgi:hypothetical protein